MLTDKEIRNIIDLETESAFILIKELDHKIDQQEKRIKPFEAIINKGKRRISQGPVIPLYYHTVDLNPLKLSLPQLYRL